MPRFFYFVSILSGDSPNYPAPKPAHALNGLQKDWRIRLHRTGHKRRGQRLRLSEGRLYPSMSDQSRIRTTTVHRGALLRAGGVYHCCSPATCYLKGLGVLLARLVASSSLTVPWVVPLQR
jgi:hypothetical protein